VLLLDGHAVREGDVAHVLDAAADRCVVNAGGDERGREVDSLLGGAALAVDRRGRSLDRQPGLEPGVAPDVEPLLAELLNAAGDDVLDHGGLDAGAIDDLLEGPREQRGWVNVLVVALLLVTPADRGTGRLDDYHLAALELPVATHLRSPSGLVGWR
jgi:hypothetical protein